jgi:hypothetical protein
METALPWVLMIAIGVFAMAQQAYYKKRAELMDFTRERDIMNAESRGRLEALNNPQAVIEASRKLYRLTSSKN